jgi:hypothetical protein
VLYPMSHTSSSKCYSLMEITHEAESIGVMREVKNVWSAWIIPHLWLWVGSKMTSWRSNHLWWPLKRMWAWFYYVDVRNKGQGGKCGLRVWCLFPPKPGEAKDWVSEPCPAMCW